MMRTERVVNTAKHTVINHDRLSKRAMANTRQPQRLAIGHRFTTSTELRTVATATQTPVMEKFSEWFPVFLRQELKPYPGRGSVVARMVIAATLSMIIIVTFRIPYGAIGVNCAFILSRENLVSTAKTGFYFVLAFALWALLTPVGARMFASVPSTHFLWELINIFLCFFLLRTLTNFPLTTGIVVVATGTLAICYLPRPAELNVELTLWQILATCIGAVITVLVEVVFRYYDRADPLRDGIIDRLHNIEGMLRAYSEGNPVPEGVTESLTRYAVAGAGVLRRQAIRNNYTPLERMRMSALVSLTSRSVDFATAFVSQASPLEIPAQQRALALLSRVVEIQLAVKSGAAPVEWETVRAQAESTPLFSELESMIDLMASVLRTPSHIDPRLTVPEQPESSHRLLVEDAISNPEHLKFALVGTTAAMLCYIIYVALDWPGISTAVTTCILTALSNISSSRQKQTLRIVGVMIGGFVFGLGSQVFILPYIDSITGLTMLFAAVTATSAYVATSSTRLSYVGLQMAFAFYLINVTDFSISLDLTIGRDRAVGVLLGITMMWIVFERLNPTSAAEQMVKSFAESARLIAGMLSRSPFGNHGEGVLMIRQQRDQLARLFDAVHAEADAVLFETGKRRAGHLAGRDRVRRCQTTLRTFYVMELPFLQMRLYGDRSSGSSAFEALDARFRGDCSDALIQIADRLESHLKGDVFPAQVIPAQSNRVWEEFVQQRSAELLTDERSMLEFMGRLVRLLNNLESEVVSTSVFAIEQSIQPNRLLH
jgi:multidrug resistance protein MdtO